jgi:hypothetical protein
MLFKENVRCVKPGNNDCVLGADGTFDILKYADPDLDLGSDNKTIFDDLVEDVKPQDEQKKDVKKEDEFSEIKTQPKQENEGRLLFELLKNCESWKK